MTRTLSSRSGGATTLLEETNCFDDFDVSSIHCEKRLGVLDDLDILDAPIERTFEILTRLATDILDVPVAVISLVTADRQFFVSSQGLPEPWANRRQTPLTHSFCQHVVSSGSTLVIRDAHTHPFVSDNLAIRDLGVVAYLGVPLVFEDVVLGSFCAISSESVNWTASDLEMLEMLASVTISELETREASRRKQHVLEERLRQAQKIEAIGQLAGGVAHDFNNILATIQIYTDLLRSECNHQPTALSHLQVLSQTVASAKGVIQQLLTWSQPDDGQKANVSLVEIINQSLPLMHSLLPASVEIAIDCGTNDSTIFADPNQMKQVLLDLTSNAAQATQQGGGDGLIEIMVDTVDHFRANAVGDRVIKSGDQKFVRLRVRDTGVGIASEFISRLYDPYFTTKPAGHGTGIGLWTVLGIVKGHNATIEVESTLDEGTTFDVRFPAVQTETTNVSA